MSFHISRLGRFVLRLRSLLVLVVCICQHRILGFMWYSKSFGHSYSLGKRRKLVDYSQSVRTLSRVWRIMNGEEVSSASEVMMGKEGVLSSDLCSVGAEKRKACGNYQKSESANDDPVATVLTKRFKSTRSDLKVARLIDQAFSKEFGSLMLHESGHGKTKVRNHINPLSSKFQVSIPPPNWDDIFSDPNKPLWIDVGCGQGRFGVQMALNENRWGKEFNHLGLEIREPLVVRANAWAAAKGLKNLYFIVCNANTSLKTILETYPGPISYVAVQFPDPQFKRKHHRRRVVTKEFLELIATHMPSGGTWFIQSDVEEIAAQMRDRTDQSGFFDRTGGDYTSRDPSLDSKVCADGSDDLLWTKDGKRARPGNVDESLSEEIPDYGDWLKGPNPLKIRTEREVQNETLKLPIYRATYTRNSSEIAVVKSKP